MVRYILFSFFLYSGAAAAQSTAGWEVFATVKFEAKFLKAYDEYFLVPQFDGRIKAYEGKEITLRGHYMPLDLENENVIVLSKYPYAQCFFCGGAGPESVAEIVFPSKRPKFKADQIITVKGILRLNAKDIEHMNFILQNATVVTN